jgi:cytochrome c oxidase assembly protein subunit 15
MSRLSSFQRLALWTTATTYFLIFVGGLVRVSGAGLGCPDWPRCFGSWVPPLSAADLPPQFDASQFNPTLMWTEYVNRLLGVTVGLLIFATAVSAIRRHRRTPRILWSTLTAFVLVGFQGWLGGVVVQAELAPWIVTAHLIVALVIVSLLLYATVYAFFEEGAARRTRGAARRPLAWSVFALILLTLVQVGLGAQVREGIDVALVQGTPREIALSTVGAVDTWHRDGALAVIALSAIVVLLVWTRHEREQTLKRAAFVMFSLVLVQVGLGVAMAYTGLTPPAQVAHLTASSLLLGAQTVLLLLARWLPDGGD